MVVTNLYVVWTSTLYALYSLASVMLLTRWLLSHYNPTSSPWHAEQQ